MRTKAIDLYFKLNKKTLSYIAKRDIDIAVHYVISNSKLTRITEQEKELIFSKCASLAGYKVFTAEDIFNDVDEKEYKALKKRIGMK